MVHTEGQWLECDYERVRRAEQFPAADRRYAAVVFVATDEVAERIPREINVTIMSIKRGVGGRTRQELVSGAGECKATATRVGKFSIKDGQCFKAGASISA
jgi:hypothetical protein